MFMHRITESDAENTGDAAAVWPLCVRTMSIHFSMHPFNWWIHYVTGYSLGQNICIFICLYTAYKYLINVYIAVYVFVL